MQPRPGGRWGEAPFLDWGRLSDDEVLGLLAPHAARIHAAEEAVAVHVRVLRERGASWARIGAALGISKQAAWERFANDE